MVTGPLKKLLGVSLFAAAIAACPCWPAHALPVSAKWGLSASPATMALETELQLQGSPIGLSSRLGAAGLPYVRSNEMGLEAAGNWWTTWGHYTHRVSPRSSLGGLAGLNKSWFFRGAPIPFRTWYSSEQPLVTFLGAFYQHDWGSTWLRVSPTVTLLNPTSSGAPTYDFWEASVLGPPLLEVGFRLKEHSALCIRTSITPIAYTRTF